MTNDPTIREQSYRYFLQEAPELLQVLEQELLGFRENYNINKVHNLMRTTHTMKGAAASVGLETIKSVAHSLEDIFKAFFNPDVSVDAEIEALLFEGYECLRLPLTAELTGRPINHAEILDRTAHVFTQLQQKLGDCLSQEAHIPTSIELGFDVTQSIFEVGVTQRLEAIAAVIERGDPREIAATLRTQSEVFQGLAESLNLPGFGAIAQAVLVALDTHPEQVMTIAQAAQRDFEAAQVAVLNGDRTQGGQPSSILQQLSGLVTHSQLESNQSVSTTDQIPSVFDFPDSSVVDVVGYSPTLNLEFHELSAEAHESPTQQELDWIPNAADLEVTADITTDNLCDQAVDEELTNRLLEDIWGAETSTQEQEPLHNESSTLEPSTHIRQSDITVETPPFPPSQTDQAQPSRSPKDVASVSPTVRVNVEQLEYLNYSIGELLTNQNRQSLQNEQLKAAVRTLTTRLQQHQQLLGELQEWSDRQFVDAEQWQMESSLLPLGMMDNREWTMGKTLRNSHSPIQNPLSKIQNRFDSLELDRYSEAQLLVQSILEDAVQLTEATEAIDLFATQGNQTLEKQRRLLTSARDALMEARMLPLGEVFNRFYRVLQQLEVTYNKRVTLKLQGSDVLVDKVVAEKLYDPLLHLVRNAFDHGLESPGVRQQRGKQEKGQIEISASHQGRHLLIQVRDDGQGLDFDKIRQRAIELLFSPEQVNRLTQTQLTDLLFEPGFSTTSVVNDLSGRGIGLNVVRAQMNNLQGSVGVDSAVGKGTTFTLHIPLNLTIAKLLICQAGNRVYALLTDAIEQILIPQSDQIRSWDEGKVLRLGKGSDERLLPIHHLAKVLDYFSLIPTPTVSQHQHSIVARGQAVPIILIRHQDTVIGLEVDQLIGEQELAIRPLGATISPPHYVYGGSVLADGLLALVLDGSALMQHIWDKQAENSTDGKSAGSASRLLSSTPQPQLLPAQTRTALPPGQSKDANGDKGRFSYLVNPRRVVLLVDDSITLRQTLALTLQKAGYQVLQAKDGYEGIEQLQSQSDIRLVICDIEMPRMNGFEFLKYRQHDPALAKIPVVILTSRSGEKHRLIAEELGATAYITKPFLEHNLLMMVSKAFEQKMLVG